MRYADGTPPRSAEAPTPGHYKARLGRGSPWVACRIVRSDGLWFLFVGGELRGAPAPNPWAVDPLMEWVAFAPAISEAIYDSMLAAAASAPAGDPLADPTARVDLNNAPPLYRRKSE